MSLLATYLKAMVAVGVTGEATDETSFYAPLSNLLTNAGSQITPQVLCVMTPKNIGDGIPDGGFFVKRDAVTKAGSNAMLSRAPERGAMEVKGLKPSVKDIAKSQQVKKYLDRYGQVLVTNYREFLQVRLGSDGKLVKGESFTLAKDEAAFWSLATSKTVDEKVEADFKEFLHRVPLADAPLGSPETWPGS